MLLSYSQISFSVTHSLRHNVPHSLNGHTGQMMDVAGGTFCPKGTYLRFDKWSMNHCGHLLANGNIH